MSHVFIWAASLKILLDWTTEGGTRERLVLIAFHRPGARGGAEVRRQETPSTVTIERWCRDARRPRRSSLMILLLSRSNAGSARRDQREGTVGPSEGRATDT